MQSEFDFVTFLFTDIEGSTRLWELHPTQMQRALADHDRLLREAIQEHNGVVFKTIGDAFCAAFAHTNDAVAAVRQVQRGLAWLKVVDQPLHVRMALHRGVAEARDNDYFGPTVNRVARLLSIGNGGQVLLSQAAHDGLSAPCTQVDLGTHRLKDLQQPEHVWQLDSLEFPPLRSLSLYDNNLPLQITSFVGREKELAETKSYLQTTRLLTLTGSGGCGKTRLALQVAAEVLELFPDGVWLVELAPLTDPDLVAMAAAEVLGVRSTHGEPVMKALVNALKEKHLLLILDNCEHLLDGVAWLAESLLRGGPTVKILASSREGLGISGERTYRVPSLSLPDLKELQTPEGLRQYESTQLLVERAVSYQPGFTVTAANAAVVASLCVRLDGIPLAIELAAARVRSLPVEQLAARLDDRFRLLTGGSRTALPRQQTLRALIDWSYDLLEETQKTLFRRLAVFAGGWTLAAAESICSGLGFTPLFPPRPTPVFPPRPNNGEPEEPRPNNGEPEMSPIIGGGEARAGGNYEARAGGNYEARAGGNYEARAGGNTAEGNLIEEWEVLELLTALTDKSLVSYDEDQGVGRYRLLETVRQYARERLAASGEAEAVRLRHRDYFTTFAEQAAPHLHGPEQASWLPRLDLERENCRQALNLELPDPQFQGLRLILDLRPYLLEFRGCLAEVATQLEKQLDAAQEPPLPLRARALTELGQTNWRLGEYRAARSYLEKALPLWKTLEDAKGIVQTIMGLANVTYYQGDYAAAEPLYAEALALAKQSGNPQQLMRALNNLGLVFAARKSWDEALALFEESLELRRRLGDRLGEGTVLGNLVAVYSGLGRNDEAQQAADESLAIA